ncbi:MAG: KUP/HAK/KT family potassium transporter, partial [Pseudomonadota bacterium]|nr:KUP/HAK/KT family potassium transporter [Pseudomonadota bacterium]
MAGHTITNEKAGFRGIPTLAVTALGIVFGDIGTSPLYALKTVIDLAGVELQPVTILGLLSLIVWTLVITVSVKYVTFVMRADNDGEGGILALMSLLKAQKDNQALIIAVGLFGAALIYGDGAITPAISVLSAVEGLKMAAPAVEPFILPFSVLILLTLFAVQYHGTARIGWVFGPIMGVWFVVIGVLGVWGIAQHPSVLMALNPWYGLHYLFTSGHKGFLVLGGVFLAVTGAEALYADMGHIGARPIRLAWYGLVLPALVLNYAGQTALLLDGATADDNIFYRLCPQALLLPFIILATVATVIASQAIITGAFSMTRQAIQLGWCPRLQITQTSAGGYGQIYVGGVNWMLMIITVGLTVAFGSSDRLAAAYGIAVSLTMLLTTMLLYVVMRRIWLWRRVPSLLTAGIFLCIDAAFLGANLLKVLEGGWIPLVLAVIIYTLMITWRRGAVALAREIQSLTMPVDYFIGYLMTASIARVPGTAVFLTKSVADTPPIVLWHVTHSRSLHQYVVALTLNVQPVPWVRADQRVTLQVLTRGFWRVTANYGFMDKVDIPFLLEQLRQHGCPDLNLADITYYISHETILHRPDGAGLPRWQLATYAFMQRNSVQ